MNPLFLTRSELPDIPPFGCPKCDYVAANKTMILLHYGITHKAVVQFAEKASKNLPNGATSGVGEPVVKSRVNSSNSISSPLVPATAFRCPMCSLTLSQESRSDHLTKHFYDSLSADLPIATPFSCPKCRFVGVDRSTLLRHFGSFHGMCDFYLKEHLLRKGEDASHVIVRDRGDAVTPKKEPGNGIECRLCERDEAPTLKNSSDLYRHLSETHFSEKLLRDIENVPQNVKPFKCNRPGCDFSSPARSVLVTHLGLAHRCAVKYYCEALGVSDEEEVELIKQHHQQQQQLQQLQRTGFMSGQPSCSTPIPPSSKTSPVSAQQNYSPKQDLTTIQICPVCSQRFNPDALIVHAAEQHFQRFISGAQLPTSVPFKCPRCPHFSPDQMSMLRHWLLFHKMMDSYTALCLGRPIPDQYSNPAVKDEPAPIKQENLDTSGEWEDGESNPRLLSDQPTNPKAPLKIQCLMCDDVRLVGATPLDFHKHLVEKHFRERMLALIPCTGTSPEGKPRYSCPFAGCHYEHHYKWIIAKHFGVKHRMAKQFYDEVTGLRPLDTLAEVPALPQLEVKPDDLIISSQLGSEVVTAKQPVQQVAFLAPLSQQQQLQPQTQLLESQQFVQPTQQLLQQPSVQAMHLPQVHVLTQAPQSQPPPPNQTSGSSLFPHLQQQTHLQVQPPTMQHKLKQQLKPSNQQLPTDLVPQPAVIDQLPNLAIEPPLAAAPEPVHHDALTALPATRCEVNANDVADEDDEDELDDTIGLSASESDALAHLEASLDESFTSCTDPTTYDCTICAVKSKGMTEYLRHLSKVHFKQKLLACVSQVAPFKCPAVGCEVIKKDRFNVALHYGMSHKFVLTLLQEMPEDGLGEDVEANCKLCHQSFTAHRYLFTHLSDTHFGAELDADLPKSGPWKCPKCSYIGNDPRALRVHYGVRHKVVLNHLASRFVGSILIFRLLRFSRFVSSMR